MSYLAISESQMLCNVDRLVTEVLSNNISISYVSIQLSALYLPLISIYDPSLVYSPTITAFINSVNQVMSSQHLKKMSWGYFNTKQFIDNIYSYKEAILKNNLKLIRQERINTEEIDCYMRQMLNHYSRLLIVRVDLAYITDTSHLVSIKDFHQDLKRFRKLIGEKENCFEGLQGNVLALEQGHDHGYHCHVLLMYDGSKRQCDCYLAQEVGEIWQSITGGLGNYYNCNNLHYKKKYKDAGTLGIGMIHRKNGIEVENAVRVALYLTKPDKESQQLRVKLLGMKTFTHGIYKTKKRRGLSK